MNTSFISEKEFREWQAAVAMQYGIETAGLKESSDSKGSNQRRSAKDRRQTESQNR